MCFNCLYGLFLAVEVSQRITLANCRFSHQFHENIPGDSHYPLTTMPCRSSGTRRLSEVRIVAVTDAAVTGWGEHGTHATYHIHTVVKGWMASHSHVLVYHAPLLSHLLGVASHLLSR